MNKIIDILIILISVLALIYISLVTWARLDSKAELEIKTYLTPSESPKSFQIQGIYKNNYNGDSIILLNSDKKLRNSERGYIIYYNKNNSLDSARKIGSWILKRAGKSLIGSSGYRLLFCFNDPASNLSTISFKVYDETKILLLIPRSLETNDNDQFIKLSPIKDNGYDKYRTIVAQQLRDDLFLFNYLEEKKMQYQKLESILDSSKYLNEVIKSNN